MKKAIPIAARERGLPQTANTDDSNAGGLPALEVELGPGPGRYALPSTVGFLEHDQTKDQKPAYSFGGRLGSSIFRENSDSPGPVYFITSEITRHGRDGTPSYSMLARQRDANPFKTPSPGAYSPEKVHPPGERHAPVCSMGARTSFRRRDQNPAANRYSLPKLIGSSQINKRSAPSYSMTARSLVGSHSEDMSKTPGPGQYHAVVPDVIRTRGPQYSLLGRSYMPGDSTMKPGPGAHSPEKVCINKPQAAKHSLGIRHSEFITPLIIDVPYNLDF